MIACPQRLALRIIRITSPYCLCMRAILKRHSVVSMEILRTLHSRSRQYNVSLVTRVMYTGRSSVRITPVSPLGMQYLMWLRVVYTKIPCGPHAPDLTRTDSGTVHCCSSCLLQITTACLHSSATIEPSLFHTTWRTIGTTTSPSTRLACVSKREMRSSDLSSTRPAVPAANIPSVVGYGAGNFLPTSLRRFLIRICLLRSSTANLFLATKATPRACPRFESGTSVATAPPPELLLGKETSSYVPPSTSESTRILISAGLCAFITRFLGAVPMLPPAVDVPDPLRSET
mmetsp:Transcript_2603/g.6059  ORF Transcript_2603/g.6059 Transcript_2603/m.6059 type:complete len:288 (+) Transcript_2603:1915-2778(+)